MNFVKKALAVALCVAMLLTGMPGEGWLSLLKPIDASAMAGHEQSYNDARVELDFNKGWSFSMTDDSAAHMKGFDDSSWEKVDLPHDFSMSQGFSTEGTEAESGNMPGGTGWYRKWFNLYEYYTGDCITIDFDGAYQHAYVYVNGEFVGENHYGYNSFSFEISDKLICSNTALNLIAVKVVSDVPSSRWYSGSGINRDVRLTIKGPVHVSLYGPMVTTHDIESGKGNIEATVTMHNDTAIAKKVTVETTILDYDHTPLSETVVSDTITISAKSEKSVLLAPEIDSPELWSPDNPKLYKLQTVIKNEYGELIDEYHTTFGYRYIEWDADNGFKLNGEYIKLKGVCLHHDQGALGAVQEYEAIYRQLVTLKEMGCNAIRITHNPASRVVIDICNELGLLVMEEFFDEWDNAKNGNVHDFSEYFYEDIPETNTAIGARGQKWFEFVVEQTILRDRHDPCIIAWDVGNELNGASAGNYAAIAQRIGEIADELDPDIVLLQGNDKPGNSVNATVDSYMDVIGGNYQLDNWLSIMNGTSDPRTTKPFVATESASVTNSRGVYDTMSYYNYQGTAYDTQAVSWGNEAAEAWYAVVTNDWFSGEFVWTGFDYIGEPTPWNKTDGPNANSIPNSSYFGIVDTAGFAKDSYYLYRSLWNEKSTTLHLVPGSWNSDKLLLNNGYVNVAVYSNAHKIELLLNGNVIATATSTVNRTAAGYTYRTWTESIVDSANCYVGSFYTGRGADFYPQFGVKYAAGTLSVKAYDANGTEITDTVGSTKSVSGNAAQIAVKTWQDRDTFLADGADYIYVEFEARDADGNFMNDYNGTIDVQVDDASARYAEIVGVDNGNPATTDKFQQPSVILSGSQAEIKMFNGKALVILRTTEEEGTINITAVASENGTSFPTQGITVTSVKETGAELTDEFEELITQSGDKYESTVHDKFETIKNHFDQLQPPSGDSSGGSTGSDKFEIYLGEAGSRLPDGDYAITVNGYVVTGSKYDDWSLAKQQITSNTEPAPSGSKYTYESFSTDSGNVYTFTYDFSNGKYTIKNADSGSYVYMNSDGNISFSAYESYYDVQVTADGSIRISATHYLGINSYAASISGINSPLANYTLWLYTAPTGDSPSEPSEPSVPSVPSGGDMYGLYSLQSDANQPVEDGEYLIAIEDTIMPKAIQDDTVVWGSGYIRESVQSGSVSAPSGAAYLYDVIKATSSNEYSFIYQGNNQYHIKHKESGLYVYIINGTLWAYPNSQMLFNITPNADGSVYISNTSVYYGTTSYIGINGTNTTYFGATTTKSDNCKIWLYSESSAPSTPSTPSTPTDNKYTSYTAVSDNTPVADGEYVICNTQSGESLLVSGTAASATNGAAGLANVNVSGTMASDYSNLTTTEDNIYIFTSQGNGKYYIQHKASEKYLSINQNNSVTLSTTPVALNVTANADGEVRIYNNNNVFLDLFKDVGKVFSAWASSVSSVNANEDFRLYSAPKASEPSEPSVPVSGAKADLYKAMMSGLEVDLSPFTKASCEKLLEALEAGIVLYNDPDATDADVRAATAAILAAIEALDMDIKQIKGTLFKYGYSNADGFSDYSDGGLLMNDIIIDQMKTAILADKNLVDQIKNIIGYDTVAWEDGYADDAVEDVAEAYARIYSLQFSGSPVNGLESHSASNASNLATQTTRPPVSLWNLWTKVNTDDSNDDRVFNDGASVQGLASATLEKGVIKSHAAYYIPLSYANDGPDANHDIDKYTYTFNTGSTATKTVTLDYLSGISVYFPDLFTRENIDVNGNVTTATTGDFAKYYWDAEFPMFIDTDEHGVNTYHFDSRDTNYLVQGSFNDSEQTVDMALNEVGSWSASGSANGSGFFPFNYKQGVTSYTGQNAIYHYGFTFEHNFYIPNGGKHANGEDVVFNFSGDDDVYVYIDGVMVLDNGGLHGARAVTINFTECTINYQFAMDVTDGQLKGGEYELTYEYNKLIENHPDAQSYNADTVAALNKLHDVITDGDVHTLNFFYLERGSTDSNCRMSFNLSETSEDVRIIDQVLTLDYGLPVEYNITENNNLSQAALENGVKVEYLGLCAVNTEYSPTYTFEKPKITVPFEDGVTYTVEGMKYGTCTIDKQGNTSYTPKSMNMTDSENFYVVAKITGDPTYAEEVVYYQVEKTTFVPATAIYYEDTFDTVTYTDGTVPSNYDNTAKQYGIWKTEGLQQTTLKQNADLTDSEANPYGYEANYTSFAEYSGGSVHYVDVSTKNNPKASYSGGSGASWPKAEFTFTGTGFDLISVTDNTTGAFSVTVKNAAGKTVKNTVVDTFYGYNYGRIYSDENGKPTLDDSFTAMYRSENGTCTSDKRYYDENGALTKVPHYYDENGNVVETETDNPAYAYAYGWVVAKEGTTKTLYQIPVIKIKNLAYGSYSVVITPTFTSSFGHASVDDEGINNYSVYLDAIKIYSPAGEGDNIVDKDTKDAYATDDELYPSYLEIKDMLIGADSLSENDTQGVIFIDGIAALNNDIDTYKNAGPNNELYLAKDQAVAFEIWATSVPTDVQIGVKLACGSPRFTVSYGSKTTDMDIETATDIYYSLNTVLPNDAKLTWRQVTGSDGNNYYTTGTVVIQNTGAIGSVLSVTNMKWTFSQNGGKGYFRIPTPVEEENLTLTATVDTQATAYSLMKMRTAALDIEQTQEPEVVTDEQGNSTVTIKLRTSADVDSVTVTDENGKPTEPKNVTYTSRALEGEDAVEWTVIITTDKAGTHVYMIAGAYENGYTDGTKAVKVTVTVEPPVVDDPPEDEPDTQPDEPDGDDSDVSIIDVLISFFRKIVKFILAVFSWLGIEFNIR